jgi:hypothetical protein
VIIFHFSFSPTASWAAGRFDEASLRTGGTQMTTDQ